MVDVLLDIEDNPIIRGGDFALGDVNAQNQRLLLLSDKGDWKEHPACGVGLDGWLADENPDDLYREIREQFSGDGLKVKAMKALADGKLMVDANY